MKQRLTIQQITIMALMAALICILAPNSVPIGPVPISLTNLVVYFSVFILGAFYGSGSYLIYMLLGLVGLPVFSGYQGGLGKLAGPTGGYIIGLFIMAIIGGIFIELGHRNLIITIVGWIIATAVDYTFGTAWYVKLTGNTLKHALEVCVYPFILIDLVKIVLATLLGKAVYTALKKAGLLKAVEK